jgi:hypothetical protein
VGSIASIAELVRNTSASAAMGSSVDTPVSSAAVTCGGAAFAGLRPDQTTSAATAAVADKASISGNSVLPASRTRGLMRRLAP